MRCKVNQAGGADLVGVNRKISLEVVASAGLGDIPSRAKRVPKGHGSQIQCEPPANCWRHREKYPAESSKMMKGKGFWYPGGYCPSSKARTQSAKMRKVFLFWLSESGPEGKTWKSFLCSRATNV